MVRKLIVLLFVLTLVVGGGGAYLLLTPYSAFDKEVFVDIPPKTSSRAIASMLQEKGVIQFDWTFLLARAAIRSANLQAGEYHFDRPISVLDAFFKISRGDVFFYELRIPEGSNMFDVAAAVERLGLMKADAFLQVARNPAPIKDIAPGAPSLEGYLFPSTYRVTRHTSALQIAREMTQNFRRVWDEVKRSTPLTDTNRLVTLASLVEKETAVPAERSTVASVYANRLALGMKLDCDPTTIYAAMLEGRYRGTIYRSDLDRVHPYNTYRVAGLPPGPIANPGRESLKAALEPASTKYIYFVAKPGGLGEHSFSESLSLHNLAVQEYRNGAPE
jgi:UPF0755 protein